MSRVLLLCFAGLGFAQTQGTPAAFEVASIRPTSPSAPPGIRIRQMSNGILNVEGYPLATLLELAFGAKSFEIEGAPKWVASARYDINAKAPTPLSAKEMWPLLRTVLEERFQLRTHREPKPMSAFRVTVGKAAKLPEPQAACFDASGPPPPLTRAAPGQRPNLPCDSTVPSSDTASTTLWGTRIRMSTFVSALTDLMGRPVVDKTGFTGTFDLQLKFDRDGATVLPPRSAAIAPVAPSIVTALSEQLGLKLESARESIEVIVIDRIERPTEN